MNKKVIEIKFKELLELQIQEHDMYEQGEDFCDFGEYYMSGIRTAYKEILIDVETYKVSSFENKVMKIHEIMQKELEVLELLNKHVSKEMEEKIGYFNTMADIYQIITANSSDDDIYNNSYENDDKIIKDVTLKDIARARIEYDKVNMYTIDEEYANIVKGEIDSYNALIQDMYVLTVDVFEEKYYNKLEENKQRILEINDKKLAISQRIQGESFAIIEILKIINPRREDEFLKYIPAWEAMDIADLK